MHCNGAFGSKSLVTFIASPVKDVLFNPARNTAMASQFLQIFLMPQYGCKLEMLQSRPCATLHLCTPFIINCSVSNPATNRMLLPDRHFLRQMNAKPRGWCLQKLADPWLRNIICPRICPKVFWIIGMYHLLALPRVQLVLTKGPEIHRRCRKAADPCWCGGLWAWWWPSLELHASMSSKRDLGSNSRHEDCSWARNIPSI